MSRVPSALKQQKHPYLNYILQMIKKRHNIKKKFYKHYMKQFKQGFLFSSTCSIEYSFPATSAT